MTSGAYRVVARGWKCVVKAAKLHATKRIKSVRKQLRRINCKVCAVAKCAVLPDNDGTT